MKKALIKSAFALLILAVLSISIITANLNKVKADSIDDLNYCWYVPEYFNNDYDSNYKLPIIESNDVETARKNGILKDDSGDPFIFEFVDRNYIFYLMNNGGWSSDIPSPIPTVPYYFMISIYSTDDSEYIYIDLLCLNLVDDNYVYLDYLTFDYLSDMENLDLGYTYLANYGTYNVYYPQYPFTLSKISYNNGISNDIKVINLPSYLSIYNNKNCGLLSNLSYANNPISYSLLIDSTLYTPFVSYPTNLNASYDSGYDEGYSIGFNNGYDSGKLQGSSDGYNYGYDEGFRDGYYAGHNDGIHQNEGSVSEFSNVMSIAWNSAVNFLNTPILGELKIIHFIMIPMLLGLFLIILKLIRG